MMSQTREEAVWKRVMEASVQQVPEPGAPAAQVLHLIEQTRQSACIYRMLAAQLRCPTLRQLERSKTSQSQELAAVYYMMAGKRPQRKPTKPTKRGIGLRACYEMEHGMTVQYRELAGQEGAFSAVFSRMARDGEQWEAALLRLLGQYIWEQQGPDLQNAGRL